MNRTAIALWGSIGFAYSAIADEADRNVVLDQLHAKFSACAAFYAIEAECTGGGEKRRRLAAVTRRASALAGAISMAPEAQALRLELNLVRHRSLMGEDCAGVTTLEERFATECDPLSAEPE